MNIKKVFFVVLLLCNVLFSRDVVDSSGSCQINWTQGHVVCEGESEVGQSKYAADLAAKVIAQRNMLEVIKGIHITSEVTIKDGLEANEVIKSRVSGVIRGAQIVSKKYNSKDKFSVVTVKIKMGENLMTALLSDPSLLSWNEKIMNFFQNFSLATKAYASTYTPKEKETILKLLKDLSGNKLAEKHLSSILENMNNNYTGILIDIRDLDKFQKALIVKLVDSSGDELYPLGKVSKAVLTKRNTTVGYMFGMQDARKNSRIFDNPIEIKVKNVYKNKLSNIVLDKKQIEKLDSLDERVLENAKIILVLGD